MINGRISVLTIIFFVFSFYNVYGCYQSPIAKATTVTGKTSFVVGQLIEFTGKKAQPYKFSYDLTTVLKMTHGEIQQMQERGLLYMSGTGMEMEVMMQRDVHRIQITPPLVLKVSRYESQMMIIASQEEHNKAKRPQILLLSLCIK